MTPKQKAEEGLSFIKQAIVELLEQHSTGLRNADIAAKLNLHSDFHGSQKDYLSWSVLGLLMNEGSVKREDREYFATSVRKSGER